MRFFSALCMLCCFCASAFGAESKIKHIDALLSAAHSRGVFNGVVLVAQRGAPIYQHAIGFDSATRQQPLNRNARFPIGSIAKEFSAVGIMFLVEAGKLRLETRVAQLLPGLPSWAEQVRVSDLLGYTSGLPRMHETTDELFFQKLKELKALAHQPGEGYIYSNANVFLQQKIIEGLTGKTYPDFLRTTLFARSGTQFAELKGTALTAEMAGSFDNDWKDTTFSHGGERLYLTAYDLYQWASALHAGKIISFASLRRLAERSDANSESGLGAAEVDAHGVRRHSHHGSGNNYEAVMDYLGNSETTIILLSNHQNFKLRELSTAIAAILDGQPYQVPKKSIYLDIRGKLERHFDDGIRFYSELKRNKSDNYDFASETGDLVKTANYLIRRERFGDAISVLHLSLAARALTPQEQSGIYELLGACHSSLKQYAMASLYLDRAAALDPANKRAASALTGLAKQSR